MRKRLLMIVLLCMLSLPLSAFAGRTYDGNYCAPCDNINCICGPGEQARSIKPMPPKGNAKPGGSEEGALGSGALVLVSLVLLLLRTRAL